MKTKIRITETQLKQIVNSASSLDELDYNEFKNSESLDVLRNSLDRNKMVSVVFVKKDGSIRPMLIRKKLSSYEFSDRDKSDRQSNVQENNNILHVVDVNVYKKALKENGGDRGLAAKMAYRSINLQTVLGFMGSGRFFDLREENNIRERFGEQIYNSLTKTMVNKLAEIDQEAREVENNEPQLEPAGMENAEALNESQHKDLVKKLIKNPVLSESSKKMKNRIYKSIYRSGLTSKLYHDDHWGGVKSLIELISTVEGVTDVNFGAKDGGYRKNNEGTEWKEYMVEITTIDGKLEGMLTAHAAGSVQDPFDRYDITLVIW